MHVLMHCIYFPPEVGGLESHVFHLCRALVAKGHQVSVVTSRSQPEMPPHEVMSGVEVWRTPLPGRRPVGWILHSIGAIPELKRRAKEADVIHAQAFASVLPCATARPGPEVPLIATYHTSHFLRRAERPRWRGVPTGPPGYRWTWSIPGEITGGIWFTAGV